MIMSSEGKRHRIRSLGGDGFEVIRSTTTKSAISDASSSNPTASLPRAQFGSLGTKMRSYTESDSMRMHERDGHTEAMFDDDKTTRSPSPFFGRPVLPRRAGRHSFSVLSNSASTPLSSASTASESPKKRRRGSRLLSALTVSLAKTSLHSSSRPSSSHGFASTVDYQGETSAIDMDGDVKDDRFARDASAYEDDKAPRSSASAYQQSAESSVPSSDNKSPTKKARRLSIDMLTRRWSSANSSASPSVGSAFAATGDTTNDNANGAAQDTADDKGQGSFSLHSFRKLRQESSADFTSGQPTGSYVPYSTDALSSSVRSGGYEHTLLHGTRTPSERCTSPVSLSKPTSPLASQPGSPRLEHGRASIGGSMSAGMFLRAAARARPDLSIATGKSADDRADSVPTSPSAGAMAAAAKPLSPYRPLTPLGEGTQSPAEELALLEADLARARQHSLAYLAEMEEKEARRQELRQRRRQNSYSSNDALGVHGDNRSSEPTSYFPPFDDHRDTDDHVRRAQSPRIYTSETLLDKLARLEQQVFQGQVRSPSHSQRRLE